MTKENIRWKITEKYYGVTESKKTLCFCQDIIDSGHIIDALVLKQKGRPFEYKAEKIAEDYNEIFDNPIQDLGYKTEDYTEYMNGISCI